MRPTRIFHVRDDGSLYEPLTIKGRKLDVVRPIELRTQVLGEVPHVTKPKEFIDAEEAVFIPAPSQSACKDAK